MTSSVGSDGNGTEKVGSVTEEILWEGNAEDIPDIASIVKTTNSKVSCIQWNNWSDSAKDSLISFTPH